MVTLYVGQIWLCVGSQKQLYDELFKFREEVSENSEQGLSTYMVATNKNLLDIAKLRYTIVGINIICHAKLIFSIKAIRYNTPMSRLSKAMGF